MLSTLVLFVLFTVGSAVGVNYDCTAAGSGGKLCIKEDLVGKCDNSTKNCIVAGECGEGTSSGTACGEAPFSGVCEKEDGKCFYTPVCDRPGFYCTNANIIGVCSASRKCDTRKLCLHKAKDDVCGGANPFGGKCDDPSKGVRCIVEDKILSVNYVVEVPSGEGDKYEGKISEPNYTKIFPEGSSPACSPVETTGAITGGTLTVKPGGDASHFDNADPSVMACTEANYFVKFEHTKKCLNGVWTGRKGVCAKKCPTNNGTESNGGKTIAFGTSHDLTPADGALTCNERYGGSAAFCILDCGAKRVTKSSEVKCEDSGAWSTAGTVEKGACGDSTQVSASASLILEAGVDLTNVLTNSDKAFKDKFVASVSALLGTAILPENVKILSIKERAARRLQVDYTIRVPKGDPEGAAELVKVDIFPEDDDRLPVGGGLRGIH